MSGGRDLETWRERLLARCGGTTVLDRVGFVLALSCDELGATWISTKAFRLRVIAIWPKLFQAPKRGRHAGGISPDSLKRALAAHPEWISIGRVRYPDRRLGRRSGSLRTP